MTNEEQGRADCRKYYYGQAYGSLTRTVTAEDAMRLFWPPVNEMMTQIAMPLPTDRKEWIAGFKAEQVKIRLETDIRD